jgi:hypothetical protein
MFFYYVTTDILLAINEPGLVGAEIRKEWTSLCTGSQILLFVITPPTTFLEM